MPSMVVIRMLSGVNENKNTIDDSSSVICPSARIMSII